MALIDVDHASLTFRIRQQSGLTLKEFLVRRLFKQTRNPYLEVKALQDVSFKVEQGERLGVIGHNGAGKSTLLRLLAGIYPPTAGRCSVEGKISSLFDISVGFEPEASGWENIALRGYLQGETPTTVRAKVQEIADFSELGEFLDMPVRFYSSGMKVRLAFSIATSIEPEILLIDEVLSAGDLNFQQKAGARMRDMMSRAKLMVMVSHDLDSIAAVCDRVLWMDHGRMRRLGKPDRLVNAYRRSVEKAQAAQSSESSEPSEPDPSREVA